ncbi:MAG: amidohydrolase family protein [Thermodesulfobacteriota bacterium]
MRPTFHKAGWVFVKPGAWIENGIVEVAGGRIISVRKCRTGGDLIDHGPGVIMPALINAHTHLSLSALRARVEIGKGFVEWVKDLISARSVLSAEDVAESAARGAQEAKDSGTGFLAEVGSVEPGATAMKANGLEGIVFSEVLGNSLETLALRDDDNGLSFSFAGHGLHTTSPDLLRAVCSRALRGNRVFSMHLAESEAETEFLATGRGLWADLLNFRGIDFGNWGIGGERPVQRALRFGLLGPRTVAVHLLEVSKAEISILADTGTAICLCPRSNFLLHGRLPNIGGFIAAGLNPALGTDSLASTPSLSLFDEMAFVSAEYPELPPDDLLAFSTINAAKAIGRSELGTVEPGQRARLIYVDIAAHSEKAAALELVACQPARIEWL